MATLGFDTATAELTVAVTAAGDVLAEREAGTGEDGRPRHATQLLAEVERCAEAAGGWERIDRIAVGVGPGSFTGLRIGIATARALAQGRVVELAPVSTLSALARGIAELAVAEGRSPLPVLDARRGQAFAAAFGPGGEPRGEPLVCSPERLAELAAGMNPPPLAAGDGALRFLAELEAAGATVLPREEIAHRVAARHVCALGEATAAVAPDTIEPVYLREPDAKRWIQEDEPSETA
ncbi:MAG: tRNA (adenosine(37)-N6)-threonylcarbamoyltransferase complex dimerization subunit type 1 TsaB [Actinobacteria bacterium]|nr:tRNA (adenosine(37)-N6)-threonylcarbamoyltransferase complex dimerization subunit type 1 TsaB [Actinomycetota bacterium]